MRKQKKKINNTIDLILLIVYFGISIYFLIEMLLGKIIPYKYILMIAVVLFLILIGTFYTYKIRNQAFRSFRKIYLVFLSVLLMLGSIFQGQIRSAFSNVDNGSTFKSLMYVVTLSDSNNNQVDDLTSIGYLNQSSDLIDYSLSELAQYSLSEQTYHTLDEELEALDDGKVDAVLISAQDESFKKDEDKTYRTKYKTIDTIEMSIKLPNATANVDISKEPFVVYLSGLDNMGEPTYNALSDVNMLLMVNPASHHVEMISINRDTYVPNPKLNDYPDKLTHLGWYGANTSEEVLERVFGIKIDYFAKVTFESLIKIIDTIGGIDIDVKISFTEQDENRSFAENDLIHLEKGYQHLNGKQALAYARHRKTEGWDVSGREKAQRDIISAVAKKMLSVDGALKAGEVLNVAASYVSTNMPMDSAKAFLMKAINSGTGWSFGSSTVNSKLETSLPCAMENGVYRNVVLLQKRDILRINDLYTSMYQQEKLNAFAFDLNDMEKYLNEVKMDPHVITMENYYDVVPTYFPEYVVYGIE